MPKILNEVFNTQLKILESTDKEPGVLATVAGTFAEYAKKNKNGRFYGDAPWRHALEEDEDVKRALDYKIMYGELDHPADYLEVKIDKTAICVTKLEMNEAKGTIEGELKVLDTPAGQLLNTLIRFGSILGVSSRASGELDHNGNVIPETFKFVTFDIVTNPSNAGALPHLVESADGSTTPAKSLYEVLMESIENADLSQLKIIVDMSSTLEEEKSTEIINKVEVRKAELLKEQSGDHDEVIKGLEDKIDTLTLTVNGLVDFIHKAFPDLEQGETETPEDDVTDDVPPEEVEPVVESTTRVKPKIVKPMNEGESRKETTVEVTRIVEDTSPDNTERRVEHLVKTHKSK